MQTQRKTVSRPRPCTHATPVTVGTFETFGNAKGWYLVMANQLLQRLIEHCWEKACAA